MRLAIFLLVTSAKVSLFQSVILSKPRLSRTPSKDL